MHGQLVDTKYDSYSLLMRLVLVDLLFLYTDTYHFDTVALAKNKARLV